MGRRPGQEAEREGGTATADHEEAGPAKSSGPPCAGRAQAVRRTPPVTIPVLAPESGGLQSRAAHTLGACGRQPRDSARSLMRWLLSAQFPPCRDASGSEVAAVERPSKSRLFPLVLSASPRGQRRNKSEDQAPQKERRPRAPASGGRARRLRCGVGGRAGHATRRSVFLGGASSSAQAPS